MMLHETRMLREPQGVSWANGQSLCLYGDPSYRLGVHLVQTTFDTPKATLQSGDE